ncbi:MAG: hypothetical protein ACXU95_02235, partial [Isosphaeraceae bacterium]
RVDRPLSRPRAPLRGILLAGQAVVGEPLRQPPANQLLEVLVQVGMSYPGNIRRGKGLNGT